MQIRERERAGSDRTAALRLIGAVLAEQDDEWSTVRLYFSQQSMDKLSVATDAVPSAVLDVASKD